MEDENMKAGSKTATRIFYYNILGNISNFFYSLICSSPLCFSVKLLTELYSVLPFMSVR